MHCFEGEVVDTVLGGGGAYGDRWRGRVSDWYQTKRKIEL